MSDRDTPDDSSRGPGPKRRRLPRSCDNCRRKKVRCNSSENPGNKCSNCVAAKVQCTHFLSSKENNKSTVSYSNPREHVAAILSTTATYIPSDDPAVLFRALVDLAQYARSLEGLVVVSGSSEAETPTLGSPEPVAPDQDEGLFVNLNMTDPLQRMTLHPTTSGHDGNYRFFGKSSTRSFLKDIMDIFNQPSDKYTFNSQRPEFWAAKPWQSMNQESIPPQSFPQDDLLAALIDLYFERVNPLICLLHAPSFRRSVAHGEHLSDLHFGALVLLVSALASRCSDDPRVLMDEDPRPDSAGWKWFRQVKPLRLATSFQNFQYSLYKLQVICLSSLFIAQTSVLRACWVFGGIGIRMAQEMGAHRRGRYLVGSRIDAELLKRAFWVLLALDTIMSSLLGRPSATTIHDFDVDFPAACDDEYWEAPQPFRQPAQKPSTAAYMTPYLELILLLSRVQRAIYPVKKSSPCPPEVVAELDSALNQWVDSIPSHLRWDPNLKGIFLDQSASLYAAYYHVQILIHRPFISAPAWVFPSLAICANSARSCGHVMDAHFRRAGHVLYQPHVITVLFDCAVILLMNVWGSRRERLSPVDVTRAKADIKKCVDVLGLYENIWALAGRKLDMLTEILHRSSENPSQTAPSTAYMPSPIPPLKRGRDAEDEEPATSVHQQLEQLEQSIRDTDDLFTLPLSTEELGLLPVYQSFDFDFDASGFGSGLLNAGGFLPSN
ncbi:fungal-specific transcription factor domain-containing protein [Roridomyces roridus]|uniref:Fungal-specific transcription factor domain-containing protein n=1 Tax=Roridomyces roridus TaxID=1738132 RepID=A0AAD7F977_9AGAR|nr:fungal-specific transcription factor domain-containing protein [Roridomyces roridus]